MNGDLTFPSVTEPESGQKLLQFLERRLGLPSNLLHRWIRTGQIRLNGKRCKPFVRIFAGDQVRLPPFAAALANQVKDPDPGIIAEPPAIIGQKNSLCAYFKPAGLPSQPGTMHEDALSVRLANFYADKPFIPVPCHRLDKDTSGVILVANSFETLKATQEAFKTGDVHKEYLAWADGEWPHAQTGMLKHFLRKEGPPGQVKIKAANQPVPYSREALSIIRPLLIGREKSLLQIRLITGRTHQIRAQLAAMGMPVTGDGKYGAPGSLMLHSMRIKLPNGECFECLPSWTGDYAVNEMPEPILEDSSREALLNLPLLNTA